MPSHTKHEPSYIRQAYDKYRRGDHLTDQEMEDLRDHMEALADHVLPLRDMHIIFKAIAIDRTSLNSYVQNRKRSHLRSV